MTPDSSPTRLRACLRRRLLLAASTLAGLPGAAAAQIDYRNLDGHRPSVVEDAYPVERYAFEVGAPIRSEWFRGGRRLTVLEPELAYGGRNLQIEAHLALAQTSAGAVDQRGLAGLQVAALFNFTTETLALPALSLRAESSLPFGGLAGDDTRLGLTALATRSFGAQRIHLNLGGSMGGSDAPGEADGLARWHAGVAVDHTVIRRSLLLVAELRAAEHATGGPVEAVFGAGGRIQLAPALVLDAGVSRRVSRHGPQFGLSLGLSHAFAVAAFMPDRAGEGKVAR